MTTEGITTKPVQAKLQNDNRGNHYNLFQLHCKITTQGTTINLNYNSSAADLSAGHTSTGRVKVQDCWNGHDPELNTWILKSTATHSHHTHQFNAHLSHPLVSEPFYGKSSPAVMFYTLQTGTVTSRLVCFITAEPNATRKAHQNPLQVHF